MSYSKDRYICIAFCTLQKHFHTPCLTWFSEELKEIEIVVCIIPLLPSKKLGFSFSLKVTFSLLWCWWWWWSVLVFFSFFPFCPEFRFMPRAVNENVLCLFLVCMFLQLYWGIINMINCIYLKCDKLWYMYIFGKQSPQF